MKTAFALALLLSATPVPAASADAAFDPKEKITLELKDAKIADLVTTLGALANLPVYIDPDVSGTITIKMGDTSFEDVLKTINSRTGVFVRIENGKLVASRSTASLFATLTLPDRFRSLPRMPVADVRKAMSNLPPLYVQIRLNGTDSCARLAFPEGERPTITVPLSEDGSVAPLYVTQFEVDPVSRTRYLAFDGAIRGAVTVGRSAAPTEHADPSRWVVVQVGERAVEPCREQSLRQDVPRKPVTLSFAARETRPDGSGELVMAPRLSLLAGTTAKARTGQKDSVTGQQRELVLAAYVSRDGKWATVVFTASAIWLDPSDGSEYFYSQPFPVYDAGRTAQVSPPFLGLPPAGWVRPSGEPNEEILTIIPGAAAPRAVDLFLLAPGESPEDLKRK